MAERGEEAQGIKLVVFDWAGTLIDHGSIAPVRALVTVFERAGVTVTNQHVRASQGLGKRSQIEHILRIPEVLRSYQAAHGHSPTPAAIDQLFDNYVPSQLAAIRRRSELIEGALDSFKYLREERIAIATTTGYFRAAAELVLHYARQQELEPDFAVCADDVPEGRPSPHMIQACMRALDVRRPREVLVVGDTTLDVLASSNAGCISVAVAGTGNEVGLSSSEWEELHIDARNAALAHAHRTLRDAGAEFVIDTLADLPLVVQHIAEHGLSSAA